MSLSGMGCMREYQVNGYQKQFPLYGDWNDDINGFGEETRVEARIKCLPSITIMAEDLSEAILMGSHFLGERSKNVNPDAGFFLSAPRVSSVFDERNHLVYSESLGFVDIPITTCKLAIID